MIVVTGVIGSVGISDPMHTAGVAARSASPVNGQAANAVAIGAPWAGAHPGVDQASALLKRLFRGFDGSLALRLWNDITLRLGKAVPHESDPRSRAPQTEK